MGERGKRRGYGGRRRGMIVVMRRKGERVRGDGG
jgi:hypothetical protein